MRTTSDRRKNTTLVLLGRDGSNCHYCGLPLGDDTTIEHIVPQTLGGPRWNRLNLVLTHKACNGARGASNAPHPGCSFCSYARERFPVRPRQSSPDIKLPPLPDYRSIRRSVNRPEQPYGGYNTVAYDPAAFGG